MTTQISIEAATEALWDALDYELVIKPTELFDRIALHLRRNPRFQGMSITEIDLLLADVRCELEFDLGELASRVVQAFRDFSEADGVAA
jgi:hypothetical protein